MAQAAKESVLFFATDKLKVLPLLFLLVTDGWELSESGRMRCGDHTYDQLINTVQKEIFKIYRLAAFATDEKSGTYI